MHLVEKLFLQVKRIVWYWEHLCIQLMQSWLVEGSCSEVTGSQPHSQDDILYFQFNSAPQRISSKKETNTYMRGGWESVHEITLNSLVSLSLHSSGAGTAYGEPEFLVICQSSGLSGK
jgi:hypothetical protein